jgi:hypothetical protein
LEKIQTKVLRVFVLVIHSHLPWDFYFFKLTQTLTVFVKEKGVKHDRKPPYSLPLIKEIHTKTSSMRILKVIPRNLNEIVHYVHE